MSDSKHTANVFSSSYLSLQREIKACRYVGPVDLIAFMILTNAYSLPSNLVNRSSSSMF